jgi:hypothetical protein
MQTQGVIVFVGLTVLIIVFVVIFLLVRRSGRKGR